MNAWECFTHAIERKHLTHREEFGTTIDKGPSTGRLCGGLDCQLAQSRFLQGFTFLSLNSFKRMPGKGDALSFRFDRMRDADMESLFRCQLGAH